MSKRYSYIHNGEKILGNTPEAIAFRVAKTDPSPYQEIFERVNSAIRVNPQEPPSYKEQKIIKKLSLKDYISGASALVSVAAGGAVSQEEINRRAVICTNCPKVTEIPGCHGCGLAAAVNETVNKVKKAFGGGYTIPNNLQFNGCGVCSCALSVMIPAKMSQFKKEEVRPTHCWVNKKSPNYRNED